MTTRAWSVLLVMTVLAGARAEGPATRPATDADLLRLRAYLVGDFSSAAQAAADPENFREVQLSIAPIWATREGEHWLYVEQSMPGAPPYRQRVYQLVKRGDGRLQSVVYELPGDPLAFAGADEHPGRFDRLTPEMLKRREGCDVFLSVSGDAFVGGTEGRGCASQLRGAAYATSEVTLLPDRMITWDRGFDAEGTQVWGATAGGYVFIRQPG